MTAHERGHRRDGSDRGATLTELLVTVVVMGVIATALLTAVATFLRNDESAAEQIDESRDLQSLSNHLPADVSSAFVTELQVDTKPGDAYLDANDPATVTQCPGYTTASTNALDLKWSENFGGTIRQYRVGYRVETVAGEEKRLVRVSCSGTTLGGTTVLTVARRLRSTDPVRVRLNGPAVEVTLTEKTGRTLTLAASSQNPHAALDHTGAYD